MSPKFLKIITKTLLLSVIAIVPFLFTRSLYFPYISGKVYVFRALVALAFFFWVWLMLKEQSEKRWTPAGGLPGRLQAQSSFSIFKNILVIALLLFFLAQVLVSFFGVDPVLSFFSSIERGDGVLQYGFWALYFLMLTSVFKKEQDWRMLFSVFIIVAILSSLYSWFNYSSQIRLYAIFGNSSYLAVFLLFAIGFCAIVIERRFFKNYFLNILTILAAGFFAITLIATQTRGAYAGLAGGIFLFCLLSALFLRKENKKLALFCGIALAVGLTAVIALFSARETDFVQNTYILKRTASVAKLWQDDVVRERLLVWQIALKAFKERPIFGWGPENFGSAANKYYDYRVGVGEPWFDRAHSQPIDTLATGGIVVFSFYLFWLAAVIYLIFKIGRPGSSPAPFPAKECGIASTERRSRLPSLKAVLPLFWKRKVSGSLPGEGKKVLSFILASLFLAYFIQGLFLFDTLPTYLGLFPFLGFLVFSTRISTDRNTDRHRSVPSVFTSVFIGVAAIFVLFVIYTTCFVPYKANAAALKFYAFTEYGIYKGAKPFLEQAFSIKSPYTFWEVRKRAGWQFLNVLQYGLKDTTSPDDIQALKEIYDFITPELEKFVENRPYEPQMYYILARVYRFGYEKLGREDLDKAERILRKGFNYSEFRVEYFNEFSQILLLQGKFEEAEKSAKDYIEKVNFDEYFSYVTLGHFYFAAGKQGLAMEQYEQAREMGYKFYEVSLEYSRYMFVAEETGEYQRIVDMAQNYLERWGPDADTFFNIAVGYLNLEEKEKAREFFLKAVELKVEYEEYRSFFAP